ncbi:ArsR family transcriptional regulator [Roseibium sp. RKSG952]|uniref:ArsR family transcriptional regulator n=1 Tax=Roseibium sp. RKSG952 TaxID=2529384 RepID=UPI0012BCDE73|nr:ArsR family transcriptional regulator [Roseibium sp. RKSG952]MTH94865.1 ArsR family transcriptional regulator [Roseibium sp. RKSG952]
MTNNIQLTDTVRKFREALEVFHKLDAEIPIQTVLAYLHAVEKPGQSVTEISKLLETNVSTVSRQLASLTKTHRNGLAGYDLLVARDDDQDDCIKKMYPTTRGCNLMEEIEKIIK